MQWSIKRRIARVVSLHRPVWYEPLVEKRKIIVTPKVSAPQRRGPGCAASTKNQVAGIDAKADKAWTQPRVSGLMGSSAEDGMTSVIWHEAEAHRVDAVPKSGGRRTVRKHMTEVRIASLASDLDSDHSMASVFHL